MALACEVVQRTYVGHSPAQGYNGVERDIDKRFGLGYDGQLGEKLSDALCCLGDGIFVEGHPLAKCAAFCRRYGALLLCFL